MSYMKQALVEECPYCGCAPIELNMTCPYLREDYKCECKACASKRLGLMTSAQESDRFKNIPTNPPGDCL